MEDKQIIGKITNASIESASKNKKGRMEGYNGCVIAFVTDENLSQGDKVQITLEDGSLHPFDVKEITITDSKKLNITAVEVGYWARHIKNKKGFDIRTLLSIEVELITDSKRLSKINEESCWC